MDASCDHGVAAVAERYAVVVVEMLVAQRTAAVAAAHRFAAVVAAVVVDYTTEVADRSRLAVVIAGVHTLFAAAAAGHNKVAVAGRNKAAAAAAEFVDCWAENTWLGVAAVEMCTSLVAVAVAGCT